MTPTTTEERLKLEFMEKRYTVVSISDKEAEQIAYFFLQKRREEMVEIERGVEKLRQGNRATEKWSDDYYHALDDVLSIIRSSNTTDADKGIVHTHVNPDEGELI